MTQNHPTQLPKSKGLGRGLDALFGDTPDGEGQLPPKPVMSQAQSTREQTSTPGQGSDTAPPLPRGPKTTLAVTQIVPGAYQPRKNFDEQSLHQLSVSIREHGIIQPLLVRPLAGKPGFYELIAGERRWRAAQLAQLHDVPVVVNADLNDVQALEIGLIENVQREDLNVFDEAMGYKRLIDEFGFTPERLGDRIGKSRAHVANILRLLSLPESVRAFVIEGKLTAGHVRPLIGLPETVAVDLADKMVTIKASARQAEKMAAAVQTPKNGKGAKTAAADTMNLIALQDALIRATGLKVTITARNETSGSVQIEYKSLDQFDQIKKLLSGE